jgi:aminomethyltransferase
MSVSTPDLTSDLLKTPLHALHVELGAKMTPFAGYDMPVAYPDGILAEHRHCRASAALFDVSHMGQLRLAGDDAARALESLMPMDIVDLGVGRQRYGVFTNSAGGILDDLMVTRGVDPDEDGALYLVVNAACKTADYAHIEARLPANVKLVKAEHRALIALQGPGAEAALAAIAPEAAEMGFMTSRTMKVAGHKANVSRSGYTGEDGYEISAAATKIGEIWDTLLLDANVKPIGLGARDSLRLEAGLCLYGHDIDTTTSPVEAGLNWSIQKRRREEGGFPGAARIQREFADGVSRIRVGLKPEGRAPAREGSEIATPEGEIVGKVTSGGFGPTLNGPCAMGYVAKAHSAPGTQLNLIVRGKPLPAVVAAMPFVPNGYKR